MKDERQFDFELIISTTGAAYSVTNAPYETTVQDVINAFMESNNLDIGLGLAWTLIYCGRVLSKDTILSTLLEENTNAKFELIAKAAGA